MAPPTPAAACALLPLNGRRDRRPVPPPAARPPPWTAWPRTSPPASSCWATPRSSWRRPPTAPPPPPRRPPRPPRTQASSAPLPAPLSPSSRCWTTGWRRSACPTGAPGPAAGRHAARAALHPHPTPHLWAGCVARGVEPSACSGEQRLVFYSAVEAGPRAARQQCTAVLFVLYPSPATELHAFGPPTVARSPSPQPWALHPRRQLHACNPPCSYGFAIILLTVLVKVATYPLTKQQVGGGPQDGTDGWRGVLQPQAPFPDAACLPRNLPWRRPAASAAAAAGGFPPSTRLPAPGPCTPGSRRWCPR